MCRKKGSIIKRLNSHEVDSTRAHEQLLASMQMVNQLRELVVELRGDKRALQTQQESLEGEMHKLRAQLVNALPVTRAGTTEPSAIVTQVTPDVSRTDPQSHGSNHEVEEQDSESSSQRP